MCPHLASAHFDIDSFSFDNFQKSFHLDIKFEWLRLLSLSLCNPIDFAQFSFQIIHKFGVGLGLGDLLGPVTSLSCKSIHISYEVLQVREAC